MLFGLWQNAQKTDVRGRQSKRQARHLPRLTGLKFYSFSSSIISSVTMDSGVVSVSKSR